MAYKSEEKFLREEIERVLKYHAAFPEEDLVKDLVKAARKGIKRFNSQDPAEG